MTSTVRKALDQLEDVLLQGGQDAWDLLNILSALRGPDSDFRDWTGVGIITASDWKRHGSGAIRAIAFPRLWDLVFPDDREFFPIPYKNGWVMQPPKNLDPSTLPSGHYKDHILYAKEALERKDDATSTK